MRSIIVFGAAGRTGKHFVEQALKAGYRVTAVVHNHHQLPAHPQLNIIKADVFDPASFAPAIAGVDVVVSCIGAAQRKPTTIYSQGSLNIIEAMQKHQVKRFICLSAGAVVMPSGISRFMKWIVRNVIQRIFGNLYSDMRIMEKIVSASGLNWTIIRLPRLTNGRYSGQYRMTINQPLNRPSNMSRASLAGYMLQNLHNSNTFQTLVEISR